MAIKDFQIIDHAIPTSIQDSLENVALGNTINWFRHRGATYAEDIPRPVFPITANSVDTQQFTHSIFEIKQPVSQLFPMMVPLITAIPYTIKQLIRIKMNLCVFAKLDNPDAHGMPHVDFSEIREPLLTAIYYVNESTGDTILFDQKIGHKGPLTVKARVGHKKGRLLIFDGSLLHAGNTPRTNTPRVNINFNAFVYEGGKSV